MHVRSIEAASRERLARRRVSAAGGRAGRIVEPAPPQGPRMPDTAHARPALALEVVAGPHAGQSFTLAGPGPFTLGRQPDLHVTLAADPSLSRVHCSLRLIDNSHHLPGPPSAPRSRRVDHPGRHRPGALSRQQPAARPRLPIRSRTRPRRHGRGVPGGSRGRRRIGRGEDHPADRRTDAPGGRPVLPRSRHPRQTTCTWSSCPVRRRPQSSAGTAH